MFSPPNVGHREYGNANLFFVSSFILKKISEFFGCKSYLDCFYNLLQSLRPDSKLPITVSQILLLSVLSPITDLVTESKDAIHLPVVLAGAECIRSQHDILEVAHHCLYQGGQSLTLQRLQKCLVEVLCGVAMARVEAVMAKSLMRNERRS